MGNTPPSSAENRPALLPPPGMNERTKSIENEQTLKSNFQLISPMSDISNPSQFRHRFPAPVHRELPREARFSKGESRVVPRSRSLPAPSRFYFDTEHRQRSPEPGRRRSLSQRGRSRTRKWKRKAIRAKQQLTSCWKDHDNDGALHYSQVRSRKSSTTHVKQHYVQPTRESQETSNRLSLGNQAQKQSRRDSSDAVLQQHEAGRRSSSTGYTSEESHLSDEDKRTKSLGATRPYLQLEQVVDENSKVGKQHTSDINFRPVWKEQKDMAQKDIAQKEHSYCRPRHQHSHPHKAFLHSEENFLERILEKSGESNSPSTSGSDLRQDTKKDGVTSDKHLNHLSRLEQALSSPVAKLFQDQNSSPDSPYDEESFAGASEKSSPYDEKRARDEAKTAGTKPPLRASLEPIGSKQSLESSDPLHARIGQAMQRQIDEQIGSYREARSGKSLSRVERLQSQFQEHVQKLSAEKKRPTQNVCAPSNPRDSSSKAIALDDPKNTTLASTSHARSDKSHNRSSSAPPQRLSAARMTTAVAVNRRSSTGLSSTRSSSVPPHRRRSSTSTAITRPLRKSEEMPGLLFLAGWNPSAQHNGAEEHLTSRRSSQQSELPVLLQLAGWNRTERSHPIAVATNSSDGRRRSINGAIVGRSSDLSSRRKSSESSRQRMTVRFEDVRRSSSESSKTHPTRIENRGGSPHRKRSEPKDVVTTASMLQQTFPIAAAFSAKRSFGSTAVETDYRHLALKAKASPDNGVVLDKQIVSCSPALSEDSHIKQSATIMASPPVTQEALRNAAFLFSPSYDVGSRKTENRLTEASRHGSSSFTISTLGSRSRLSAMIHAVEIPHKVSSQSESGSTASTRRQVRFSDADDVITIERETCKQNDCALEDLRIPNIESKMSDLTDVTQNTCDLAHTCADKRINMYVDDDEVENVEPVMNWSYCKDDGMDNGVTPLRPGQLSRHATNSPYIRFQEAKSKFASATEKQTNPVAKDHCADAVVKQSSPIKRTRGGLVHARIEAMEQQHVIESQQPKIKTKSLPKRARRGTTGYKVLAPRKGSLVSQFYKLQVGEGSIHVDHGSGERHKGESYTLQSTQEGDQSHEILDTEVASFQRTIYEKGKHLQNSGAESYASSESRTNGSDLNDESDFVAIMHPNKLDEESIATSGIRESLVELFDENQLSYEKPVRPLVRGRNQLDVTQEEDEDDFAELLNYQNSYDEHESVGGETASTVRQDKSAVLRTYFSSYNVTNIDKRSCSSHVSTAHAPSTATICRNRDSLISIDTSTCTRSTVEKTKPTLGFREMAPVRPTEQKHIINRGTTNITLAKTTPMQARTWRALAAAAHEKDSKRALMDGKMKRKSFAELNPNTMGF